MTPDRTARRIVGSDQYAPVMANFAVRLVHGPGWDPACPIREQVGWDEHAAFMDGLVDTGFIILGGPVGDGEQTLHAVEAPDENEIRTRLARDPWASAGLLRIGTIEPWALWLDGRPGPQAPGSGLTSWTSITSVFAMTRSRSPASACRCRSVMNFSSACAEGNCRI